eukprot:3941707-Rhodomonas_salina.1
MLGLRMVGLRMVGGRAGAAGASKRVERRQGGVSRGAAKGGEIGRAGGHEGWAVTLGRKQWVLGRRSGS